MNGDVATYQEFALQHTGVSCTVCGQAIAQAAPVWAASYDQARNGGGWCDACYQDNQQSLPETATEPIVEWLIEGLNRTQMAALVDAGLDSLEALVEAEDEHLLTVEGIGPSAVQHIRAAVGPVDLDEALEPFLDPADEFEE